MRNADPSNKRPVVIDPHHTTNRLIDAIVGLVDAQGIVYAKSYPAVKHFARTDAYRRFTDTGCTAQCTWMSPRPVKFWRDPLLSERGPGSLRPPWFAKHLSHEGICELATMVSGPPLICPTVPQLQMVSEGGRS